MTEGSAVERSDVVCPLCGYETVLYGGEDPYCPHCFAPGSRPAQPFLEDVLAMSKQPARRPVTRVIRDATNEIRSNYADPDIEAAAGHKVRKTLANELSMRVDDVTTPMGDSSLHVVGVPIATSDRVAPQTLRIWPDLTDGGSQVSAFNLGESIAAAKVVHFPEVVLLDD